jgi:hypothetical protein
MYLYVFMYFIVVIYKLFFNWIVCNFVTCWAVAGYNVYKT